jgi:lathosterol oxidase
MADLSRAFLVTLFFDAARYALVAIPAFAVFWIWRGEHLRARWLRPTPPDAAQSRRELLASLRTIVIFACVGTAVVAGRRAGVLRIYEDPREHGIAWLIATPFVLALLQDAYFYATHRAMHHPLLFRRVHLEHHLSRHTSPLTAYAFSPIEALVHAAFVPIVTLVMPAHQLAVFAFLAFMIVRNVVGHLGIEVFPRGFLATPLGALSTTTTHHALHHQRPGTGFGLYLTLWDRAFGTMDPTYDRRFAEVTEHAGS